MAGNKNSGRKTIRDEAELQKELDELWSKFKPKFEKLGIKGNVKVLNAVFGKRFPDKMEIENPKQVEEIDKLRKDLKQMIDAHTRRPKVNLP